MTQGLMGRRIEMEIRIAPLKVALTRLTSPDSPEAAKRVSLRNRQAWERFPRISIHHIIYNFLPPCFLEMHIHSIADVWFSKNHEIAPRRMRFLMMMLVVLHDGS